MLNLHKTVLYNYLLRTPRLLRRWIRNNNIPSALISGHAYRSLPESISLAGCVHILAYPCISLHKCAYCRPLFRECGLSPNTTLLDLEGYGLRQHCDQTAAKANFRKALSLHSFLFSCTATASNYLPFSPCLPTPHHQPTEPSIPLFHAV